jgi:hypothetical protein
MKFDDAKTDVLIGGSLLLHHRTTSELARWAARH